MDLREKRRFYIAWFIDPFAESGLPQDALGLKYLKYTEGEKIPMTLLIPDRNKENREDFIWCIPIERVKWNKWYALSEKFNGKTPMKVRFFNRMEGKEVKTVIVMPNSTQSDDDAETACAWLRMVKGVTCRMYVVRCTDDPLKGAGLIHAVMGVDPSFTEELEDPDDEPNKK